MSGIPDMMSKPGMTSMPGLPGISSLENRALGENTHPAQPINLAASGTIVSSSQLFCFDFDERCRWKNVDGILVDELDWFQGIGYLDANRLEIATGTKVVPEGYYAIVATEKVHGPTGKAILVSDVIQCQRGMADLKFSYWTSPKVQLRVCTKKTNRLLPDYEQCSDAIESGDPGPALIPIPDQGSDSFQIYIIAENFVWQAIGMQGGFAVIDNIEYRGQMCSEEYAAQFREEAPYTLESKDFTSGEKHANRANDEEVPVRYIYERPTNEGLHANDIEDLDMIDIPRPPPLFSAHSQRGEESESSAAQMPDACAVLSCSYDRGDCIKYTTEAGWNISSKPVGNPLTGIRGDATVLPYNKDGSFAYLAGPKHLGRLVTPAFDLPRDVYFVFAYHKVDKSARFRVYAKRADQHHEMLIFEAPGLNKEAKRWFREGKVLQRGLYQYIAFEVRNLTKNHYLGLDELMILDAQRQPFCVQSKF
ncbi:unnamed protein product, partial [Mesorhabditis spiculigera]